MVSFEFSRLFRDFQTSWRISIQRGIFVLSRLLQYTIGEKGMKAIERKFSRQGNKIGFFRGCLLKRLLNCQQGINTANHSICRIGVVNLRNSFKWRAQMDL